MHERSRGLGNVNYLHDSGGFRWYGECCCHCWWSVKCSEHIVYLQRADNYDDSSNFCAGNDCSCVFDNCAGWSGECDVK
jgi:hypothetical protein